MRRAALSAAFLLLVGEAFSQAANDLNSKCDCPTGYDFCSMAMDTVTYKKNFAFTICSKAPINKNGIHLYHKSVVIESTKSKQVLFKGVDSIDYETVSAKGKLQVLKYIRSFDYRLPTRSTTFITSLPVLAYGVSTTSVTDTSFVFPYKKLNPQQCQGILDAYKTELNRLKNDDRFKFNFNGNLSQLLQAALNNNKEAKGIITNLKMTLKEKMKGKIVYAPDEETGMELIQNSIEMIYLREKLK